MTNTKPDSECRFPGCAEAASGGGGLCIYHSSQPKDEQTARRIWEKARDMATQGRASFIGWCFPPDPAGRYFAGVDFFGEADFRKAVFEQGADFEGATLHALVTFEGARFRPGCVPTFDQAVFKGPVKFRWTEFSDGSHFKGAVFKGTASFERARFCFAATFTKAIFEAESDFSHTRFETAAYFEAVRFEGRVTFEWARIARDAIFERTVFKHDAVFQNVDFEGNVRFQEALFERETTFKAATYKPGRDVCFDKPAQGKPFHDLTQGKTAYDLAKRAAYGRRDLLKADDYCHWEWRAKAAEKRGEKSWLNRSWGPVLRLLLYGSGSPYRLLCFIAVLIVACGVVYYAFDCIDHVPRLEANTPSIGNCLYFSAATFVGLSYGDWQPKGSWSVFACVEALLGAFLMAWFIVAVARRLLA